MHLIYNNTCGTSLTGIICIHSRSLESFEYHYTAFRSSRGNLAVACVEISWDSWGWMKFWTSNSFLAECHGLLAFAALACSICSLDCIWRNGCLNSVWAELRVDNIHHILSGWKIVDSILGDKSLIAKVVLTRVCPGCVSWHCL